MPKLPFKGFPGSAHYRVKRDVLTLRYRFPNMEKFCERASEYRESQHQKRVFFEWARKFLFSKGEIDEGWIPVVEEDASTLQRLDQTITLGEAIRHYLHDCEHGSSRLRPRSEETLSTVTRPVLEDMQAAFGDGRLLASVTRDEVFGFVQDLGGKLETKKRHLCPISSMFTWAIREGFIEGPNPAQQMIFWREEGEKPHDGVRKSYSDDEFQQLVSAAAVDAIAEDAVYLARYLALRPHDLANLRWEDWKWDQLLVAVRRMKTRGSGAEVSHVDIHPVLAKRYADRKGDRGYCLTYVRKRTKIDWPPVSELLRQCRGTSQSAVARELGVSVQALRKRLKRDPKKDQIDRLSFAKNITKRVSKITKAAGLYEKGIQPLYVLRHTFACDSLRHGVAPAIVAKEMDISVDTLMKFYWHAIPRGELDDRHQNRWGLTSEAVR
ncbi:tyrosine-type recombinase/integrase [Planctomycetota bacterium]